MAQPKPLVLKRWGTLYYRGKGLFPSAPFCEGLDDKGRDIAIKNLIGYPTFPGRWMQHASQLDARLTTGSNDGRVVYLTLEGASTQRQR